MITQPSLSHAIAAMEDELGVKLFEKEGRNVVLTRFGHIFLQDVERALAVLDGAITTMQMAGSGSGSIELGFLRILGTEMVPQIIRGFLNQNIEKDIPFSLNTGITFDLLTDLVKRRLDIVL
ncbi:LysR family transcriptional regulator, partial [Eubacterium aggregans]|uniref:LysR family transcriptional regulator n=1 Tax=Eubacterium aggregans TaxID=81409 RepID=UPI003F2EDB0F